MIRIGHGFGRTNGPEAGVTGRQILESDGSLTVAASMGI